MYRLGIMCQYQPTKALAILTAIVIVAYVLGRIIERRRWAKTVAKTVAKAVRGRLGKILTPEE